VKVRHLLTAATLTLLLTAALPVPLASQQSEVILQDFEFRPAVTRLAVGEYGPGVEVRWVNNGPSTHTVTAEGGAFDSKALAPGAAFLFRFEAAGTFDYHCTIHSAMKGQIIITMSGY
jgi:plastocyanin